MALLTSLVFLSCLVQDREATFGKSNPQILAMGRKGWYDFFTGKAGDSTMAMAGADSLYGDALAWRTDRLKRPGTARLRKLLQDTKNDAVAVGSALTEGGTMWNITSATLYADAEETLYFVLGRSGKAPKRVVSDVTKAMARLTAVIKKAESPKTTVEPMNSLRKNVAKILDEAKRYPRRESDVLLSFCISTIAAAATALG